MKAGQLLVSGVAGYLIYKRFWRLSLAEQRVDAPGSFFWILLGRCPGLADLRLFRDLRVTTHVSMSDSDVV